MNEKYPPIGNDYAFPWGDPDPEDGYHVGDVVGIFYSDHDRYIFDNPTGVVVAVREKNDDQWVTVQVEASVYSENLYLIQRGETNPPHTPPASRRG